MNAAHSAGPWVCRPHHASDALYSVHAADGSWLTISDAVHEANARLIAAAPDLLAALLLQNDATEYAAQLSALALDGTRLTEQHMAKGRSLIEKAKEARHDAIARATGASA